MNYKAHYYKLIMKARNRSLAGYTETHHIKPRCLGGTDDAGNLVDLSAREHFTAHLLLMFMYPEEKGLAYACSMMSSGCGKNAGTMNRYYEMIRSRVSDARKNSRWINKDGIQKQIDKSDPLPAGWSFGTDNPTVGGYIVINNGRRETSVPRNSDILLGWQKGMLKPRCANRIWINNGKKQLRVDPNNDLPDGFTKGQIHKCTVDTLWINNGTETKLIKGSEKIPIGWTKGNLSARGKYYNNSVRNKLIKPGEPIPEGFVKGSLKRGKRKQRKENT